ncbi:hypothetical protein QQP08_021276 [Theobroma cacao]|nr:hypothetical protein QQP08_021276 [Theobroma cacao]
MPNGEASLIQSPQNTLSLLHLSPSTCSLSTLFYSLLSTTLPIPLYFSSVFLGYACQISPSVFSVSTKLVQLRQLLNADSSVQLLHSSSPSKLLSAVKKCRRKLDWQEI